MVRNLAKIALGMNLGTVLRLVRFGPRDALDRAREAYRAVRPFEVPEPPIARAELESPADELTYANAEWDPSVVATEAEPLRHSKVLDLEDFRHPDLVRWIREIYAHELRRFGPRFPEGYEDRKQWEVAMLVRALSDCGALRPDAELLGVGAGNDPISFFLTNLVRRVFATDLYLPYDDKVWAEADVSMLRDPGSNWPFAWNPRRLVVQHMDGRDLQYEDGSFDGIFSAGSIEHFGTLDDIRRSAEELYRVLKPSGILALTTEFRLHGGGHGGPGLIFFTPELIREYLIGGLSWELVDPADFTASDATRRSTTSQAAALEVFRAHVRREGRLLYHRYRQVDYPIITMYDAGYVWTSICLVLRRR
jgi:SAM-dependent methyltransferase